MIDVRQMLFAGDLGGVQCSGNASLASLLPVPHKNGLAEASIVTCTTQTGRVYCSFDSENECGDRDTRIGILRTCPVGQFP